MNTYLVINMFWSLVVPFLFGSVFPLIVLHPVLTDPMWFGGSVVSVSLLAVFGVPAQFRNGDTKFSFSQQLGLGFLIFSWIVTNVQTPSIPSCPSKYCSYSLDSVISDSLTSISSVVPLLHSVMAGFGFLLSHVHELISFGLPLDLNVSPEKLNQINLVWLFTYINSA